MDDLFELLGGKFRFSMTDSTMMWIVHYAMDRAHGKVKSKEGVIGRLNEISKFYELAVIQLEGCMKFVQDETDNMVLESSHEKILQDLVEIRDHLKDRLQDSELALRAKDRELRERFENELKLRQALEVKERELVSLYANLELERKKSEDVAELTLSNPGNGDEDRGGEFCELMHSVDQQVWNIEHIIDEERNRGTDHEKIEHMVHDINNLKETLHGAFGKMQNAIFLSQLGPKEQEWRWTIEKEVICALISGYMKDIEENFETEMRKQEQQIFIGLGEHLSDLMKEVICLHNELEYLISQNEAQPKAAKVHKHLVSVAKPILECKIPPMAQRSLSEGDSCANSNTFSSKVEGVEETKPHLDEPEEGADHSVSKIIKKHESLIRIKDDELNWLKQEMHPEEGHSTFSRGKDLVSLKRRIQEVIVRLDKLTNCNSSVGETLGEYGGDPVDEILATKMISESDVKSEGSSVNDSLEDVWKKMDKTSVSNNNIVNEEQQNEIRILKEGVESTKIETQMRDQIFYTVYSEAVKELGPSHVWEIEHLQDVCSLGADVRSVFYREMHKQWNENIESYSTERLTREEISWVVFDETIKDIVSAANYTISKIQEVKIPDHFMHDSSFSDESLEIAEYLVKENVYMAFFWETIDEWKKEIDACNIENLFRDEIHQFVLVEAMKDTCKSFMEAEALKQSKISADKMEGNVEGSVENNLIEKLNMLLKCLEEEKDPMPRESSKVNQHNADLDLVGLEHEQLNEQEIFQESENNDNFTFTSLRCKLEKALDQLTMHKTIMSKLGSSLGREEGDQERGHDQTIPEDIVHDRKSICQQEDDKVIHTNQSDSMVRPIHEFSQLFENFGLQAHEKLVNKNLRLEELKHQFDLLVELVTSVQKRELVYRTAFIRRSQNLQKAENEVDMLGDQVDALLGLLEKIYMTLHQYSPVLQQHFEVSEMLKLIQKVLIGEIHSLS